MKTLNDFPPEGWVRVKDPKEAPRLVMLFAHVRGNWLIAEIDGVVASKRYTRDPSFSLAAFGKRSFPDREYINFVEFTTLQHYTYLKRNGLRDLTFIRIQKGHHSCFECPIQSLPWKTYTSDVYHSSDLYSIAPDIFRGALLYGNGA